MLMPEMLSGQLRNRKQQSEKCLNTKKTTPKPQNPQQTKTKPKLFRAVVSFFSPTHFQYKIIMYRV